VNHASSNLALCAALLLAACGSLGQATLDSGNSDVVAAAPDVSTGDQSPALGADVPPGASNVDGRLVDSGGGPGPVGNHTQWEVSFGIGPVWRTHDSSFLYRKIIAIYEAIA
jgi:hypothetical protein